MNDTLTPLPLESDYAKAFRVALNDWTDQRHLSRSHLWALWVFGAYLENLADAQGWRYDGHSWKASQPLGVLVVKGTLEGLPVVCFTSARTFLNSISIFVRKVSEDSINWVKDKFRT